MNELRTYGTPGSLLWMFSTELLYLTAQPVIFMVLSKKLMTLPTDRYLKTNRNQRIDKSIKIIL
ncbi:MAG: hypothetical protein Q8R50_12705 [Sediminibacterium sp.]|nr:hypothetical protein [Sediminibacterium sp.]